MRSVRKLQSASPDPSTIASGGFPSAFASTHGRSRPRKAGTTGGELVTTAARPHCKRNAASAQDSRMRHAHEGSFWKTHVGVDVAWLCRKKCSPGEAECSVNVRSSERHEAG